MRRNWKRGLVLAATVGLFLTGCADEQASDDQVPQDTDASGQTEESGDDDAQDLGAESPATGDTEELEDPNDDVEDGIFRGHGVTLPIPEGWSIDQAAFQQGVVVATPEAGGDQQLTAQALDLGQAEAAGTEPMEFEALLDGVRDQVAQEADTDEAVDLGGADRAHRLTFLDLPGQQEGQPESGVTLLLAESGDELIGEFVYSATSEDYDDAVVSLLVEQAGFDPDSEPRELTQPPATTPAPGTTEPEESPEGESPDGEGSEDDAG